MEERSEGEREGRRKQRKKQKGREEDDIGEWSPVPSGCVTLNRHLFPWASFLYQ